ncbi:MAG: recombinase family protein, partial [Verrucomicrobia bacterium]|nr:recombinase family protein [Verrucomicrobiota bacterium]
MLPYFGYIRVSTAKQGEKGVSLQEQRDAIVRYAERGQLPVSAWFEEQETAAKRGRPVFNEMLRCLRKGEARGVIIHKIDRSARNLKDWSDLGELIDQGIEVHFANESLDLHSRGGRLSADIQAVVAADYIRNLREETRKGFYGRIKQGLYPLPAPVGYLDRGKGNPKEIDPVRGPLVRRAFELYATGRYTLETLGAELFRRGLRNRRGGAVTRNGWSKLLNNPFYICLIHLNRTGETFPGAHAPLIPKAIFDRVQEVLAGKYGARSSRHDFSFRRLLTCARCGYSLIGERQKGHVYYRCHTIACPTTGVREEAADAALRQALTPLRFSEEEKAYLRAKLPQLTATWATQRESEMNTLALRKSQLRDRLNRLTDAFIDGTVEKPLFEERKAALLMERQGLEEQVARLRQEEQAGPDRLTEFLELAGTASLLYEMAIPDEKRDLLKIVTLNRTVDGKNLEITLSIPFWEVANRQSVTDGSPCRDIPRTWDRLLDILAKLNTLGQLPVFYSMSCHHNTPPVAKARKETLLKATGVNRISGMV